MSDLKVPLPLLLESERLRLVPFTAAHIQADYIAWLNDPQIVQFSNQRFNQHNESTCRNYLASFANSANRFFAIEDKFIPQLIGTLTIYINLYHRTADLGILIGNSNQWGKGYGHEAFGLAVDSLLYITKFRKVTAATMSCNKGMIKIMEKCCMKLEATQKAQELLDEEPMDILYFAKFAPS